MTTPIAHAAVTLDNYKYGANNQSIITAENGTWGIGNNGQPVNEAYDKQHLGGWLSNLGLLGGADTFVVYFGPEHGNLTVCTAYQPGCYASYHFIYVNTKVPDTGNRVDWTKYSGKNDITDGKKITITGYDGSTTPPPVNNGADPTQMFKTFSGKVYMGSKLSSNLLKNEPKLVDITVADGLTASIDRGQLPAPTDAAGAYAIIDVPRSSVQGKYIDSTYTVFVNKKLGDESTLTEEVWLTGKTVITISADGTISDQDIIVEKIHISAFDKALSNAIKTFAGWAQTTIQWAVNSVNGLLYSTADYVVGKTDGSTIGVRGPWTAMRNIGLSLLVMALIIIAFANVLQIDIEQYGLNRMIPKIIISIIMAFFSWIVVVFFFDFTKALQDQAKGLINGPDGLIALQNIQITTTSAGDAALGAAAPLLLIAIAIGAVICMIVLLFTLLARVVMLSFLLAVAPLAFILNIVPFTSNLYKQWWTEFWKWMFMGPVAVIIIALGSVIASSVQGTSGSLNTTLTPDSVGPSGGQTLIGFLILAASLYMAATLPMQWGGKIMQSIGKFGKGAWNKTGGALLKAGGKGAWNATGGKYVTKPIAGAWKSWRGDVNRRTDMEVAQKANSLLQTASRGKYGTDRDVMARKVYDAEVKTAGENIGVASAGQPKLISRYHDPHISDFEKAAIEREMASQGDLEKLHADQRFIDQETGGWVQPTADKDSQPKLYREQKNALDTAQRQARANAGIALMEKMGSDQVLEKSVKDNQAELVVAARNALKDTDSPAGNYARSQYAAVMAGQKNKSLKDKRMNILDEIAADEVKNFITAEDATQLGDAQSSSNKVRSKVKDFQERMVNEKTNDDVPEYLRATETTAPVNAGAEATPPSNPGPNSGGFTPGGYHGEGEDD